ncbi:hypothetical protein DFJ73DRAFT_822550 [Zopfochytrium polystomum]|nr:hypothetical protein DFJ73DRAFT_822550 [Zopfochytrium polystomum]
MGQCLASSFRKRKFRSSTIQRRFGQSICNSIRTKSISTWGQKISLFSRQGGKSFQGPSRWGRALSNVPFSSIFVGSVRSKLSGWMSTQSGIPLRKKVTSTSTTASPPTYCLISRSVLTCPLRYPPFILDYLFLRADDQMGAGIQQAKGTPCLGLGKNSLQATVAAFNMIHSRCSHSEGKYERDPNGNGLQCRGNPMKTTRVTQTPAIYCFHAHKHLHFVSRLGFPAPEANSWSPIERNGDDSTV